MATVDFDEDEWEILNDDGFVCKRKKRPRLDHPSAASCPPPDPAEEERNRRERKKRALTKLRDKYQKEIDQWEHLSNTLKALQDKALTTQQQQEQRNEQETTSSRDFVVGLPQSLEPSGQRILDDLIIKAEAEEEIIQNVSNLCDMAEAICNLQEERMKQSLVDLPVWRSPVELMASLCDD